MRDTATRWYILTMTVYALSLFTLFIIFDTVVKDFELRYTALEQRCVQLEQRARYYDDVMVTYQFFNEHWTATMRGEF